jgi:hypothetical protein
MSYRCPVDPDGCGEYDGPGFCTRHSLRALRPQRAAVVAPTPDPPAAALPVAERPEVGVCLLDRTVVIPPEGMLLGREEGPLAELPGMADLTQVGRRHARLYWVADVLYVTDLNSKNGTWVDGHRVETPQRVAPGQALRLALDVPLELRVVERDEFGFPR